MKPRRHRRLAAALLTSFIAVSSVYADELVPLPEHAPGLTSDPEGTRAWLPGFGERVAVYRDGLGCTLE